jgi:hypothetical protein
VDVAILRSKSDRLAKAIGKAEGFGPPENLPTRVNNPGDMELGDRGWGTEAAKTVYEKADWNADFNDKTDGASALRRECFAILSGASHTFETSWTFLELAKEWTGGDKPNAWAAIVCQELGTAVDETLEAYAWQAVQGDSENEATT